MTATERRRLERILGMLGSEHAGERAAAGLHAEAFRKKHGLTWAELLNMAPVGPEAVWEDDFEDEPEPEPPPPPPAKYQPRWPIHDRTVMGFGAAWALCVVFLFVWQNI